MHSLTYLIRSGRLRHVCPRIDPMANKNVRSPKMPKTDPSTSIDYMLCDPISHIKIIFYIRQLHNINLK